MLTTARAIESRGAHALVAHSAGQSCATELGKVIRGRVRLKCIAVSTTGSGAIANGRPVSASGASGGQNDGGGGVVGGENALAKSMGHSVKLRSW